MNTDWHLRQLKRRPIARFDSANAAAPYRGRSWPRPDNQALSLSYEQINALPPAYQVQQASVFQVGKVRAHIDPGVLERSDLAALQLMKDNLGHRPVYFSRTTGNYADHMGLTPYLEGQGLARKLVTDSVVASDSTVFVPGLGWISLSRTRTLLFDVYHSDAAARQRPRGWVDVPSEGILSLYWVMYAAYAEIVKAQVADTGKRGVKPESAIAATRGKAEEIAKAILANTSYGRQRKVSGEQ
jgi:hypothetical protein